MRWDEGSLRGTTRLKTLTRSSEKLGCADLFRRGVAPSAYFAAGSPGGGRRKECLRLWRKLPARPAKPGDTIAARRACGPSEPPRRKGAGRRGGGVRPSKASRWGAKGAERVFTFVCAGYRGRAVGDWPRERRDGGAPGSVTALAAGEAALLARDRGARGSRAFPARGRERGYFTTDGRGLQRGNEAARGLPAASKKMRVFSKKRLTKRRAYAMIINAA